MFKFLKNNKQYIVIDAGSHKIAAIAFQILDNKPYINQIEHHKSKGIKNNQLSDINEFSAVIKFLVIPIQLKIQFNYIILLANILYRLTKPRLFKYCIFKA